MAYRELKLETKATEVTEHREFADERWQSRISSSSVISVFSVAAFSLRLKDLEDKRYETHRAAKVRQRRSADDYQ
jgi:hypothetical protein